MFGFVVRSDPTDTRATLLPRYQCLSILHCAIGKTPNCRRAAHASDFKRRSCVFRKRFRPLASEWSSLVTATFHYIKTFFTPLRKTEGGSTCSRRLGLYFIDSPWKNTPIFSQSNSLYIKWHIYHRPQWRLSGFFSHHRTRHGDTSFPFTILRLS